MATLLQLPPGAEEKYQGFRGALMNALGNIFDPNKQTTPPNLSQGWDVGSMPGPPPGIGEHMVNLAMEPTYKDMVQSGILGMGPMPLINSSEIAPIFKGTIDRLSKNRKGLSFFENTALDNPKIQNYLQDTIKNMEEVVDQIKPQYINTTEIVPVSGPGEWLWSYTRKPQPPKIGFREGGFADDLVSYYPEFGFSHELGHRLTFPPVMSNAEYQKLISPVPGKPDELFKSILLELIKEPPHSKINMNRLNYWNIGSANNDVSMLPRPYHEMVADAIGYKLMGYPESNLFPINWKIIKKYMR